MHTLYDPVFSKVGFVCQDAEPNDNELSQMIDDIIKQVLGPGGLKNLVKPGDHVVIKPNIVCCWQGARGEKGRGVISDPRIVRCLAEKIRDIIGYSNGADLKVVEACFSPDKNASDVDNPVSFHWARLNRVPDNCVCPEDVCYDFAADGYLDGTSLAKLVNLDAIQEDDREKRLIRLDHGRELSVSFPKFLRRKEDATDGGEYTDVFIGVPVFKNHGFVGCTGSLKLHYGFRSLNAYGGDTGRRGHSGMYSIKQNGTFGPEGTQLLNDYITAQHLVRSYDFVLMDCLTANRNGPCSPTGAVSLTPDPDEKVDYILSHALLASKDPVAVDTVESTLGGYRYESIALNATANRNGVGISDAAGILVDGLERFSRHRKRLLSMYGPEGRYPLSTSGNPILAKNLEPQYSVTLDSFTLVPDKTGLHHVKYHVTPCTTASEADVRRVDLVVFGAIRQSITGEGLLEGEFTFRYEDYDCFNRAYVVGCVAVWDGMFNCVLSSTEFFIPPTGCKD